MTRTHLHREARRRARDEAVGHASIIARKLKPAVEPDVQGETGNGMTTIQKRAAGEIQDGRPLRNREPMTTGLPAAPSHVEGALRSKVTAPYVKVGSVDLPLEADVELYVRVDAERGRTTERTYASADDAIAAAQQLSRDLDGVAVAVLQCTDGQYQLRVVCDELHRIAPSSFRSPLRGPESSYSLGEYDERPLFGDERGIKFEGAAVAAIVDGDEVRSNGKRD